MDNVTTYYLTQGVLGVTVVALTLVIVWQQRRVDSKDKQISDLQEKRISDTNQYTQGYTSTIREVVAVAKDNTAATNLLQKSVDALASGFEKVADKIT